jgi:putative Mg2+ transporter-C (MgtC) family protein
MDYDYAALRMALALAFGAVIGMERQARQRMAGVRTNALVALGAASFVIFSSLFPGEASPTRVAAQVVSGIGFLGAGVIFRDGFNVHGLNTAATLWVSAAVGLLTGAGAVPLAAMLTGFVMFTNLALRPIVNWVDRRFLSAQPAERLVRIEMSGQAAQAAELRAQLVKTLALSGLRLTGMETRPHPSGEVEMGATVASAGATDAALDRAVALLGGQPGLTRVRWSVVEEP